MSRLFFNTMERLTPSLERGDLVRVQQGVEAQMLALPTSPFHIALELSITNEPADAAQHFDAFFAKESQRFRPLAAYTEMNGFDINPDRWYCDLFAYGKDGGNVEHDWRSENFPEYEINGLEELQAVYASDAFGNSELEDSSYMCSLLVVVKFQRFMESASHMMKLLSFPLYVTAHDFDFIAAVGPNA